MNSSCSSLDAIVGDSERIAAAKQVAARFASSLLSVLVVGETGTGKELFAAALHTLSDRRGPLVPVNCAAIPASLFEAEMFGFRRGAFTGAGADKVGLMEGCHGGTLFLDELGGLSPEGQAKLLRALETGQVRRVGEVAPRGIEVRFVSAALPDSTLDLVRRDLLERVAGVTITLPPLREKKVDLMSLARWFASRQGKRGQRRCRTITPGLRLARQCSRAALGH